MAALSSSNAVVCTLFEKNYHYGLGALANSLFRFGYRGVLYAGYRGDLPPWAIPLVEGVAGPEFQVDEGFSIRFLAVPPGRHLTYCKPGFMLDVLQNHAPEAVAGFYFDPDIVIKTTWAFFLSWVDQHIALCEDINWRFSGNHPLRRQWKAFLEAHNIHLTGDMEVYCNAGFVGLDRKYLPFLECWESILREVEPEVENCHQITLKDRSFLFHKGDQDSMNMAAAAFKNALSVIGPEGMDFIPGGYTMSHAVGVAKPWEKWFFLSALQGIAPTLADKAFFKNCEMPISLFSGLERAMHKFDLRCGSAVGRFVRRA